MLFVLQDMGWNTLRASKIKTFSTRVIGDDPCKLDWPLLFLSCFDDRLEIGAAA